MLKDILGVVGTRYLIAILNFALVLINAKALGIEGVGMIGLIIACISIILIVNGVFSGNMLVYFLSRYPARRLFPVASVWAFVGSGAACGVMYGLGIIPENYLADIYGLSVLNALVTGNMRLLLGCGRIKGFNLTYLLQGGLLFFFVLYFYYIAGRREVEAYIWSAYLTNGAAFLASIAWLLPDLLKGKPESTGKPLSAMLKEMFAYGLWGVADNMAETCTTRLNYFFIERLAGLGSVGLFDAGTKISESVWHISRSIAFIEYSRIAQTADRAEQKRITLRLFKFTALALTATMAAILLIPERIYTGYLFSPEFAGIRNVIGALSCGIIALGCHSIFSHYFIGSGKIKYSTAASCIGLATLLIAGYYLTPAYGITGSAASVSIASVAMLLFSLCVFARQTKSTLADFLPDRNDYLYLKEKCKKPSK
ncbi:MAG: polysaccharide biosynthesis C-terminal domain-containing protein [Tannerellaceae bacterium]|jgi:O-antigen/teichoic acid export membrane protein|nr:polysaccharide biosynthesis C-terminal domain-containing protein [Tannerellaceae bacterium]